MLAWLQKRRIISLLIALSLAGFIFYMSSQPGSSFSPDTSGLRSIIYHIGVFFLLTFFLLIACIKEKSALLIFSVVLMALIFGCTDELHQALVPGRSTSLFDIMLNSIGIMGATILYRQLE